MSRIFLVLLVCADASLVRAIQLTQERTPASLAEAKQLIASGHFIEEDLKQARVLTCEIALAEHVASTFVPCARALALDYPTSPEALYYAHHGAVATGDYDDARKLLEAAREHGYPRAFMMKPA